MLNFLKVSKVCENIKLITSGSAEGSSLCIPVCQTPTRNVR